MFARIIKSCLSFWLAASVLSPARSETVSLGGRSYDVFLPASTVNAHVIVVLHGAGQTPESFARITNLPALATSRGFAVLMPAGVGRSWNAGYCCGFAQVNAIDDVAFLDSVLSDAVSRFRLDADYVYVAGFSNGAMMAETWAVLHPGRFKGVAAVSGTLDIATHPISNPVPLLTIHGTADKVVPIEGGNGAKKVTANVMIAPESDVDAAFAAAWGPGVISKAQDLSSYGSSVSQTDWMKDGKVVQRALTINGGGHVWQRMNVVSGHQIDASAEVLNFFENLQ